MVLERRIDLHTLTCALSVSLKCDLSLIHIWANFCGQSFGWIDNFLSFSKRIRRKLPVLYVIVNIAESACGTGPCLRYLMFTGCYGVWCVWCSIGMDIESKINSDL